MDGKTTNTDSSDGQHPLINATIKLFSFSSRVLNKLRSYDPMPEQNEFRTGFDDSDLFTGRSSHSPTLLPSMGAWRFWTSGYALALLVMALLLNRIQNIVVPPRNAVATRLHRNPRSQQSSRCRWIYHSILPLDFSSTLCRFIIRIPSLYYLNKALLLWIVILLQTADLYSSRWSWLAKLGDFVAQKEMGDVCWFSYLAVCGALCVGALTRGLEGTGASTNSSPFNLFGYAFILHIYSTPITHTSRIQGMASRPDKHVIVVMMMPLLQITITHILGVKQRWSHQRLIPTMIITFLSLVHFHAVLWFSPASYPLLNFIPCVFESALTLVTLLTIFLNALTQLLLEGSVTRPLFGHQATLQPRWDEDFSIVLLRLGTASLEATSVAGLGNQVGGVAASDTSDPSKPFIHYGLVEMNRFGVTSISHMMEGKGRRRKRKEGFANEIKNVKPSSSQGDLWLHSAWYRELARFGMGMVRFVIGLCRLMMNGLRGKFRRPDEVSVTPSSLPADEDEESDQPDIYEQFRRGEIVSDDDEDFAPSQESFTGSDSSTPSTTSDNDDGTETVGLYADLSSGASTSAPLLLAHMTDTSISPLTRRRYLRLVGGDHSSERDSLHDDWSKIADERRPVYKQVEEDGLAEARRNCVICTVEPRQIICWPCRCLALCDDCRENLATRSSASKHTCPCCRRTVEGYSKIFIP